MKKLILLLLLIILDIKFLQKGLHSCPTCVGNAAQTGIPFFKDECYHQGACSAQNLTTKNNFTDLDNQEAS